MNIENINFVARDQRVLSGTVFRPAVQDMACKPVLLAAALGIPQNYYAPFAQWLTEQGHLVMTFDVRGIGRSLAPALHIKQVQADMLTWSQLDFAAAMKTLGEIAAAEKIVVIGHSMGAQHAAFCDVEVQQRVEKLIAVACGAGYWRDYQAHTQRKAWLAYRALIPIATALLGYFPGRRLKVVADLPSGVARQWALWSLNPQFAWGSEPAKVKAHVERAAYPLHAYSFTDDESLTRRSIEVMLDAHVNAQKTHEHLSPADLSVKRIGHVGAFRQELKQAVWQKLRLAVLSKF
ncbi:MAG: alpha/beta fold hydrolase [Brachymonas sp.]